jgi:dipeptidyl aminopeptidase/acylaminoacyl peptidase
MRNLLLFVLIAILFSCTQKNPESQIENYTPEIPLLTSDIMTPEVLWSFGRLGEPTVSPDGKQVAYTITYFNIEENKSYRDIYVSNIEEKSVRKLTNTSERELNIQWRPDGQKIGYLSSASGSAQIWEMDTDGNGKQQISNIEGDITGFKYSPDMSKIFYIQSVKLDKDIHDLYPDLPKANARLENDLMYRHWDRWHDYTYNHIFIADYNNGEISAGKDIMEGGRYDSPMKPFGGIEEIAWSRDGKTLAYTCKKLTGKDYAVSTNSDIYLYNIETGQTINFTEGMMGYDKNPVFSPDGKYLAWESMERNGYEADKNRLFVADLETGVKTNYSANFDQDSGHLTWSADGESIYFISNIQATDEIYRLDLESGMIRRLTDGVHNYSSIGLSGDKIVATKTSMSQPAELFLVEIYSGNDQPLTTINKGILDQLTMGKVEKRWIKTTDNKDMLTWIIYPPHFDPNKKYPAILYCQGGPQSTISQFWSYRWNFQMMAANGYIVVAPNRRGLPGFGMEWLEQISTDYGGQNIKDQLSAIDAMAKEPFVDENRLGAVGASYGGFVVNYLAGNHNGRFKAFISHCGIFNFEQMYATTEEMFFVDWDYGGAFWDKSNAAAQRSYSFSPHNFVQNWDTPILVIHGEKDFRIPYPQGMATFNSAILQGIPAQFLYFPEENHWVIGAQNGILWQRVFKEWLDRWLME